MNYRTRYFIYGVIFGSLFPVIASIFDVIVQDLPLGMDSIMQVQRAQPLHWVIDSAPLFLGVFALFAGIKQDEVMQMNLNLEQTVQDRTRELQQVVSKAMHTKESLDKSRALLRATLESTANGILVVDATGRISGSNARFRTMWGLPADILAQGDDQSMIQFVLDQLKDPEGFLAKVIDLYNHPEDKSFDLLEFKDGKFFERQSHPQRIDGELVGRVWSFHDITEHKWIAEALRASELQLRQITDAVPSQIAELDLEQRFRFHNKAYEKVFGLSFEQIDGRTLAEVLGPQAYESVQDKVEEVLRGYPVSHELTLTTPQGDLRDYAMNFFPRYGQGADEVIGFFSLSADITARKQFEADLAASHAQAQRLLSQLQQRGEESNMLVYSVSHDLRSPLVNLQGFSKELVAVSEDLRGLITSDGVPAEIQKRGLGLIDSDMRESIHFIQAGVMRLSNIIDAMLRLARAGRVEYHWTEVDTGLIVKRIVDSMQAVAGERGAAFTMSDLPPVWGDATAVDQIFANLIGNALNYLDPKRLGIIDIGWQPDADTHASMHTYYVRDNGLGMSESAKGKLFQIFQRFHPDQAKGEGVGLSIVRRMVERHSGKIWAESREGEGTTFFISLPIQAMDAAAK